MCVCVWGGGGHKSNRKINLNAIFNFVEDELYFTLIYLMCACIRHSVLKYKDNLCTSKCSELFNNANIRKEKRLALYLFFKLFEEKHFTLHLYNFQKCFKYI